MEFCGMKREIDRKCFIHARVHANAQSFDRCEALISIPAPCENPARGQRDRGLELWGREWLPAPRALDFGRRPEGSWGLGMRMISFLMRSVDVVPHPRSALDNTGVK